MTIQVGFRTGLAGLLLSSLLVGCGGEDAEGTAILRFTAIPDTDTTALTAKFQPVAEYLSEELGVEVEYVPVASYAASVEAFKNGEVHLAWFGGLSGVRARDAVEGARAIAQGDTDPNYKSYFIANASTGLTYSDDFPTGIEGKTFTFGDKGSTSGRLMPEFFIRQNTGKAPDEYFGEINFSGKHDMTAQLVANGTYQAGALNYGTYDTMVADGEIDPAVCVKIWETPGYPDYNWSAHPELEEIFNEGFIDKLQQALLDMKDPELLAAVKRPGGLIKAKNEDFESIRETAVQVGLMR